MLGKLLPAPHLCHDGTDGLAFNAYHCSPGAHWVSMVIDRAWVHMPAG